MKMPLPETGTFQMQIKLVEQFNLCENSEDEIKEFANEIAGVVLEGINDYFAEKAVFQGAEQGTAGAQVSKQEPKEEIAEDMLDFAFSMGE